MSHFTVLIIGENPEEQLAPFNENLDVPRYVEYTKEQLIAKGRADIKNYNETTYQKFLSDPAAYKAKCNYQQHIDYLENEFPERLSWTDEQVYDHEIRYCEKGDIGEHGEVYSQRNPNSKWDWYQLGGRWAGMFKIKEGVSAPDPNFSWGWSLQEKSEVLTERRTDQARKCEIENLNEVNTFAVLKDGKWYERGEMGWFGMVSGEKPEDQWDKEFQQLINELPDNTLLSVYDCHI